MKGHWLTTIGSFSSGTIALIIALFHAQITRLFYHPRLGLSIDIGDRADCHQTIMKNSANQEGLCYFFRLRVHNKRWFSAPARKVEVFIENVYRDINLDGNYTRINAFMPMNLVWAYFEKDIYYPLISPDSQRHCGFAHIVDPSKLHLDLSQLLMPKYQNKLILILNVYFRANTGTYILEPGRYRVNLSLIAENARKRSFALELDFKGPWSDHEDMMLSSDHMGLQLH